jgi:lipopolysaccharide/colanic/teichoic acid biosynthesis glycosyltransferase
VCTEEGIGVLELGIFFERTLERVYIPTLKESWFWSYDPNHNHPIFLTFKRTVDIAISLIGLLLFAPISPFIIGLIKIQDGGPIFYRQTRVGLFNRAFTILKFRTMRIDAEKMGAQWAKSKDNRATTVGRLLRSCRIDEVPQFWNILKGEMSFIGPRPERPEFVDAIEKDVPYYRYRHLIKPGLSGWAQINYPYGASVRDASEKLAYDFYYQKYASVTLEFLILLRTTVAMIRGAR